MSKLTTAAKRLIERYLFELAPHFEGRANWETIWKLERRFKLIGCADHLERQFRKQQAEANVARCQKRYNETMSDETHAYLGFARAELARLS